MMNIFILTLKLNVTYILFGLINISIETLSPCKKNLIQAMKGTESYATVLWKFVRMSIIHILSKSVM